jgi:DNA polymerase III gamma/tau subunit
MFENIIGNKTTISILKQELKRGIFPRASLFYGPPYTGKLSTALEMARVLVCEHKKAAWNCGCYQCNLNRELLHPYVTLLGSRYFTIEIAASADVLYRTRKQASRYLLLRAARKLTRRFDPSIWEADESTKKKVSDLVFEVEELLGNLAPQNALPAEKELAGIISSIIDLTAKLSSYVSADNIPIGQVRKLIQWTHLSTPNSPKIIIIENADNMLESSRNSLLKLLEEPPPGVYIMLTATRLTQIIPTIRSRLRHYRFIERNAEQVKEILTRIFHEESLDFSSLKSYFLAWQDINAASLANMANTFFQKVLDRNDPSVDILNEMQELFSYESQKNLITLFIQELLRVLNEYFRNHMDSLQTQQQVPSITHLENWIKIIGRRYREQKTLNLQSKLFIQNLFYQMKAVL